MSPEHLAKAGAAINRALNNPGHYVYRQMAVWLAEFALENRRGWPRFLDVPGWLDDGNSPLPSVGTRTSEPLDLAAYETVGSFIDAEWSGANSIFPDADHPSAQLLAEVAAYRCHQLAGAVPALDCGSELFTDYDSDEVYEQFLRDPVTGQLNFMQRFRALPLIPTITNGLPGALAARQKLADMHKVRAAMTVEQKLQIKRVGSVVLPLIEAKIKGRTFNWAHCGKLQMFLWSLGNEHGYRPVYAALLLVDLQAPASLQNLLYEDASAMADQPTCGGWQ